MLVHGCEDEHWLVLTGCLTGAFVNLPAYAIAGLALRTFGSPFLAYAHRHCAPPISTAPLCGCGPLRYHLIPRCPLLIAALAVHAEPWRFAARLRTRLYAPATVVNLACPYLPAFTFATFVLRAAAAPAFGYATACPDEPLPHGPDATRSTLARTGPHHSCPVLGWTLLRYRYCHGWITGWTWLVGLPHAHDPTTARPGWFIIL